MTAAMMRSKASFPAAAILLTRLNKSTNQSSMYFVAYFREITRMKQSKGGPGMSNMADEDDFQVVPVESTSE